MSLQTSFFGRLDKHRANATVFIGSPWHASVDRLFMGVSGVFWFYLGGHSSLSAVTASAFARVSDTFSQHQRQSMSGRRCKACASKTYRKNICNINPRSNQSFNTDWRRNAPAG